MTELKKQLKQIIPDDDTAVSALAMTDFNASRIDIDTIVVCNNTAAADSFRIFHDESGTTYDKTTALFYDATILANETIMIEFEKPIRLRAETANLAVRVGTGDAISFTIYGAEVNE